MVRVKDTRERWRWVESHALPLFGENQEYLGHVGFSLDITERHQHEEELFEADRHKNEFLAMLAHELRNPLAPILVSVEILRRSKQLQDGRSHQLGTDTPDDPSSTGSGDLSDRVDHALDVLQRQIAQMVRLVDDLLDASRISRGKIDLRRERVELASVVHHAVEAARPLAKRRSQELTVALPEIPVYVNADPTRLAQIVGNLLNNACKFTEEGGRIWLTVEREDARRDQTEAAPDGVNPQVVIRVRDNGVGIAPDRLEGIFDLFTQVDTALERSLTGLGIGLTLVRTLVEMHGGTVEVSSTGIGQGSEFVVRLPIVTGAPIQPPLSPTIEPVVTPLKILIVDDNCDSADMLATLLKFSGHETHTAHDGMAAVEAAINLDPDIILLDIGLPQLNGYEAARRIREQNSGRCRPVLVALTGWGQDEDRRRSEEAGFDAHIVKPVDHARLHKLLAELGSRNQKVEP
jgi:signal transduction histidine kinase/ActR/RegA family two-component response regulator